MKAQSKKPTQKRLDSCVLALPKWAKIHEDLENRVSGTLKTSDTAVSVANAPENPQARRKTTLLGKYRFIELFGIIYTTNAIESLNHVIRKTTKTRGSFPTDDAATKLIYLAIRNFEKNGNAVE